MQKVIRIGAQDPWVKECSVDDLVWISTQQLPFDDMNNYLGDNVWDIPCELALVKEVLRTTEREIWGIGVRCINRPHQISGVYIEDVMQNWSADLKKEKRAWAVDKIQDAYHKRHTVRKIAANRIKRSYIRHYWNPNNPRMRERLLGQYYDLVDAIG